MHELFDADKYEGCPVYYPDPNTLIVEAVGRGFLRLRFQRIPVDWGIKIQVSVAGPRLHDLWVPLATEQPATEDVMLFWDGLVERAQRGLPAGD